MRTVKELSQLTGISVRALHYYDEIGLLKPTEKSGAGYRLYDDKALETLQQILFFREFDIPLKEIKAVMENPVLEKKQILEMQRKMLTAKKERMERLIASIDDILKGENGMNFEVFTRTELEEMADTILANMKEEQRAVFVKKYGSMEAWRSDFLKKASSEEVQKNYQKIIEWYGSKEKALETVKHPGNSDLFPAYQKRLDAVMKQLAEKKGEDVGSWEVKELIGQYDFLTKQMYQMEDATGIMTELADAFLNNPELQKAQDDVYGEGVAEYIGRAIRAFYSR